MFVYELCIVIKSSHVFIVFSAERVYTLTIDVKCDYRAWIY